MKIGIDLGGTKIEGAVLNDLGAIVLRRRVPNPNDNYEGILVAIANLVRSLEDEVDEPCSVGIGIPGSIVQSSGRVKNSNCLLLNGHDLESHIGAMLGRDVRVANDANCFAVSEATDGAGSGRRTVFGAIFGTGVGGGMVIDGKLHAGPNGLGGEWGHLPLPWPDQYESEAPRCFCGRSNCVEQWVSGKGFEAEFRRSTGQVISADAIFQMAAEGDRRASAAVEQLTDRIARSLMLLTMTFDPDIVVVGGGLSKVEGLFERASELASSYAFGGQASVVVARAKYGDSSGVRGAAWLCERV